MSDCIPILNAKSPDEPSTTLCLLWRLFNEPRNGFVVVVAAAADAVTATVAAADRPREVAAAAELPLPVVPSESREDAALAF